LGVVADHWMDQIFEYSVAFFEISRIAEERVAQLKFGMENESLC
jgi:hypothetical protein